MKGLNVSCRHKKTVSETKGYPETSIERPVYFATLTLVHGIAFSAFV